MKHASKIRVMLVDDHFVVRAGLVGALTLDAEIEIVAECDSGEQAIAAYRKRRPDLVLMDWRLPAGHQVTRYNPDPQGCQDSQADIPAINSYDLIILGSALNSGR